MAWEPSNVNNCFGYYHIFDFNSSFCTDDPSDFHDQTPWQEDLQHPEITNFQISEDGVERLLKNLNPHKAMGPDELYPRILKELSSTSGPILQIFQRSLNTVTKHLIYYLEESKILYNLQHGFRSKRSTESQKVAFTQDILKKSQIWQTDRYSNHRLCQGVWQGVTLEVGHQTQELRSDRTGPQVDSRLLPSVVTTCCVQQGSFRVGTSTQRSASRLVISPILFLNIHQCYSPSLCWWHHNVYGNVWSRWLHCSSTGPWSISMKQPLSKCR